MGPRDPTLATGLPLHGRYKQGWLLSRTSRALVGAELHRKAAGPAGHRDLRQARPMGAGCGGWRGGCREQVVPVLHLVCLKPAPGPHCTVHRAPRHEYSSGSGHRLQGTCRAESSPSLAGHGTEVLSAAQALEEGALASSPPRWGSQFANPQGRLRGGSPPHAAGSPLQTSGDFVQVQGFPHPQSEYSS